MGFFKNLDEQVKAEARQKLDTELAAAWPSGEPPCVEPLAVGHKNNRPRKTVEVVAYIGQVGIRPEDTYGIFPSEIDMYNSDVRELTIVYRDRPEYAAGRERYWQAVASG